MSGWIEQYKCTNKKTLQKTKALRSGLHEHNVRCENDIIYSYAVVLAMDDFRHESLLGVLFPREQCQ